MDCCKRHGTITIGQDQTASLEECMKLCGLILACQSVDWQRDSGNCYFGKHSGEPTIAASGWASAHSIGCAGACKKSGGGCCGGRWGSLAWTWSCNWGILFPKAYYAVTLLCYHSRKWRKMSSSDNLELWRLNHEILRHVYTDWPLSLFLNL